MKPLRSNFLAYFFWPRWCTLILLLLFSRAQDVSIACCQSKFPTILSLLKIKNVNVINCLIDQRCVDKIIIMEHEWEARNLLKSIATSPRNLLYAITINKKGSGITQWYPAPNYRSYQVKRNSKNLGKLQICESEQLEIPTKENSAKEENSV